MTNFRESHLEEAMLAWLAELGWQVIFGPDIAPGELAAERGDYAEVLLAGRLKAALARLNPDLPPDALAEAYRQVVNLPNLHPTTIASNRAFHKLLNDGADVTYGVGDGRHVTAKARLVDFTDSAANDLLAVNQFTVKEGRERRPDIVLFVNGLPLVTVELKNPADEKATTEKAFAQLQTYRKDIPNLFVYNAACVISDSHVAKVGAYPAPRERFMPWRTVDGRGEAAPGDVPLETLTRGLLEPPRLLDVARHFIAFEDSDEGLLKKLAAYHQVHAVNVAVEETLRAAGPDGDRRIGVVWHTQGSGKSLTMLCYAGKIIAQPAMKNPTLVVLTDRNDLDDQLFGTFAAGKDLLRQTPVQAESRAHLRELLKVASGGVVFTTAQKFFPDERGEEHELLSDRQNIIVIADEAHRSQYGFISGYARHMRAALPNAAFIGFTGTPVELDDRNTRHVFGDDISIYDIEAAIADKVTVPIYYEARLAKIDLAPDEQPRLDEEFQEITEQEEAHVRDKLASKWSRLEAAVGTPKRLAQMAEDIVQHFETRQRDAIEGKAMVVAMSRRIAVDLYAELVRLRPDWHSDDDAAGALKVVMTGSASDPADWQGHIRNKAGRKTIENRFKDPNDPLKMVIVRDMWLTGFDVPSLHTMYIDKPMRGHALMQAIARVNRVFKDKPGGLVVDYLGIAEPLKEALAVYTQSGGQGRTAIDQREVVAVMLEKAEIVAGLFHGFDFSGYFHGTAAERLRVVSAGMEYILSQEDGKARFLQHTAELNKAFALAVPQPETYELRDALAFYQAVRAGLVKTTLHGGDPDRTESDLDFAVRQIVADAVTPAGVMDIFTAAGLPRPDISILSEEFLAGIQNMPHRHLALELLQKLLNDELKTRQRVNLVQSRSFAAMLEATIRRYQARTIEAAQVIVELIELAKTIKDADQRGDDLGLSAEELAFYDALADNQSAREVMGDEKLSIIAREVLGIVRNNRAIDWTVKESVRANLRRLVKRVLRHHGYPPDLQVAAAETVLAQAELWAAWSERIDDEESLV